jgi:hypothetical protein
MKQPGAGERHTADHPVGPGKGGRVRVYGTPTSISSGHFPTSRENFPGFGNFSRVFPCFRVPPDFFPGNSPGQEISAEIVVGPRQNFGSRFWGGSPEIYIGRNSGSRINRCSGLHHLGAGNRAKRGKSCTVLDLGAPVQPEVCDDPA